MDDQLNIDRFLSNSRIGAKSKFIEKQWIGMIFKRL